MLASPAPSISAEDGSGVVDGVQGLPEEQNPAALEIPEPDTN